MDNSKILCFHNVCASYHKNEILHHITVEIPKGKITTLLGSNGCGKSTLLKVIAGDISYSGELFVDGCLKSLYSRKEFARKVSLLPQIRSVPDILTEQFVCYGRYPYFGLRGIPTKTDLEIARQAMITTETFAYKDRSLKELSGGERQKVYLAMSIAQDSELFLLDEPTTYLDIAKQFEFLKLVRTLNKNGKSILMVLHDINHALSYSDYIGVIDQGKLLLFETPQIVYESGLLEKVFQIKIRQIKREDSVSYQLFPLR